MGKTQKAAAKKTKKLEKKAGKKRTEHTVQARSALLREATNATQATAPPALLNYTKEYVQLIAGVTGLLTLFRGRSTVTADDLRRTVSFLNVLGVQ